MHWQNATRGSLNFILYRTIKRPRGLFGNRSFGKRVAHSPLLRDVEKLPGPIGREQYAALLSRGVTDSNFILDIPVSNGHIGQHKIGKIQPL